MTNMISIRLAILLLSVLVLGQQPVHAAGCNGIVGKWAWFAGGEVTINSDGTFTQQSGNSGTWKCTDASRGAVTFTWKNGGFVNRMLLSTDGQGLLSEDPSQKFVSAKRIGTTAAGSASGSASDGSAKSMSPPQNGTSQRQGDDPFLKGRRLAESGKCQEAIPYFDQAIAANARYAKAYSDRGKCFASLGQRDRGLKDLDQAVQIAPHDLSPYFQRAVLRADAGNGDGALADLDHALYIDPMNPASRAARAGLFEAGGRTSEAQLDRDIATRQIDTFKSGKRSALDRLVDTWRGKPVKLSAISPQESTDPIKGALDAVGAGRYRAGLAILDAALAKDPSDDAVRGLRGQLHGAIGQANQAVEDLSSVIQRHPTAAMLVGRGLAYRQLCQFREELADYDRAVREDPKYAKAYFERAHTTMHYRKGNDPAPDLTKVIDLEPDNWMAYYMRGQEYGYWYAKIPLAMADYRKVIELKPDFARPYCDIAFALQEQGRKGEVEPWLQKCFALDPTERAVAKEALGKVQLKEQLLKREMEIRAWMRSLRPRCSVEETLRWSCAMFY